MMVGPRRGAGAHWWRVSVLASSRSPSHLLGVMRVLPSSRSRRWRVDAARYVAGERYQHLIRREARGVPIRVVPHCLCGASGRCAAGERARCFGAASRLRQRVPVGYRVRGQESWVCSAKERWAHQLASSVVRWVPWPLRAPGHSLACNGLGACARVRLARSCARVRARRLHQWCHLWELAPDGAACWPHPYRVDAQFLRRAHQVVMLPAACHGVAWGRAGAGACAPVLAAGIGRQTRPRGVLAPWMRAPCRWLGRSV